MNLPASKAIIASSSFQAALSACQLPIAEARSLPAACFYSDEVLLTEYTKIFHRHWIGFGRADRFSEPGQFETIDVAGVPILLLNDQNGVLHAFNNSCRHRGARLLEGNGTCRGIRCPFHSWNYKTDGSFVSAPHMEDSTVISDANLDLIEFAIKEHAGFLFVCFSPEPPDFEQHIGDFDKTHSAWPLEQLVSTRRQRIEVNCNWKLFLDVFNEYYHLQFVHPDTINSAYHKPDPADQTTGQYASQFGDNDGTGGLLEDEQQFALPKVPDLQGREKTGTRYTWLFPNMTFAASAEALWIYEAYPLGPQRCVAYQTLCFPQQSVDLPDFDDKVQYYYHRLDAALEEDRIALENQQKGIASPFYQPGPYSPQREPSVAAFANWYASQIQ